MGIMDKFERMVCLIERIQVAAGILSIAGIGIIIPLQVFCRYILNAPLIWPEDIGIGLMVWSGFLGAAVLYKRKSHVAIEFIANYFPKKMSPLVSLAIDLMIAFLSLLIMIYCFRLNQLQMMTMQVGTGIPRGYFYSLPLLLNTIVMFVYSLYAILKNPVIRRSP